MNEGVEQILREQKDKGMNVVVPIIFVEYNGKINILDGNFRASVWGLNVSNVTIKPENLDDFIFQARGLISWNPRANEEEKKAKLNRIARDIVHGMFDVPDEHVCSVMGKLGFGRKILSRYLDDRFKMMSKVRENLRSEGAQNLSSTEGQNLPSEGAQNKRISKKDIKIQLLEEEIARLKSGQTTDFLEECRNMPVSHCKEMILQKEQGLVKPETIDDKVEEQFKEHVRETTRERVQEHRERQKEELEQKYEQEELSLLGHPAMRCEELTDWLASMDIGSSHDGTVVDGVTIKGKRYSFDMSKLSVEEAKQQILKHLGKQ